jgi:hypothetical protein
LLGAKIGIEHPVLEADIAIYLSYGAGLHAMKRAAAYTIVFFLKHLCSCFLIQSRAFCPKEQENVF